MRIVIVGPMKGRFQKNIDRIKADLSGKGHECFVVFRDRGDNRNIMADIRKCEPDLFITEDLEGFEMCTLTDAVSYNLLHCRQFHFIFSGEITNETYLGKQLSLLMTFVCSSEDRKKGYLEKYPDIPEILTADRLADCDCDGVIDLMESIGSSLD